MFRKPLVKLKSFNEVQLQVSLNQRSNDNLSRYNKSHKTVESRRQILEISHFNSNVKTCDLELKGITNELFDATLIFNGLLTCITHVQLIISISRAIFYY